MVNRRIFVGGAFAILLAAPTLKAQQAEKVRRIVFFSAAAGPNPLANAFRQGLRELVPHAGDFDPTPSGSQRPAGLGPLEWLCHGPVEIGNEALDPLLQVLLRREAASP